MRMEDLLCALQTFQSAGILMKGLKNNEKKQLFLVNKSIDTNEYLELFMTCYPNKVIMKLLHDLL